MIYDLSRRETLPVSLNLRCHCSSGTELIEALREPPSNVCVQLVVWPVSYMMLDQEMADALIWGLKLEPEFLKDLHIMGKCEEDWPRRREHFRASQLKSVFVDGGAAAISQHFLLGAATAVPVVLVACTIGSESELAQGGHDNPSIHNLSLGRDTLLRETKGVDLGTPEHIYARIVERFIVTGRSANPSKALLLLAAMSPLLYLQACRVREELYNCKFSYENPERLDRADTWSEQLDTARMRLRSTLEKAENNVIEFFRYLGSQVDWDWSQETSYVSIKADWRNLSDEVRRLEAEIRDFMQLQVGTLALEESRKSIELSSSQIREAKSGKFGGSNRAYHH